jgi:hypothetical protein
LTVKVIVAVVGALLGVGAGSAATDAGDDAVTAGAAGTEELPDAQPTLSPARRHVPATIGTISVLSLLRCDVTDDHSTKCGEMLRRRRVTSSSRTRKPMLGR